jgi:hypothetical protein
MKEWGSAMNAAERGVCLSLALFMLLWPFFRSMAQEMEQTDAAMQPATVDMEWYEEGLWPIAGSVVAIIVSNGIAILIVYLQANRSLSSLLRQRQIEEFAASLNQFYDPLNALLDMNGEIFRKTGPPSFPEDHIEREAAAKVWEQTKAKILINNKQIEDLLREKSHLMHATDNFDNYKGLLLHVAMYETFQATPTDRYTNFRFPDTIVDHVREKRRRTLYDYRRAMEGSS